MEQSIRLSKSQIRNAKRKAAKQMRRQQQQEDKSSSSSEGKVMVEAMETNQVKVQEQSELQIQLDQMKTIVKNYQEVIYNQGGKIRELMNTIENQNNELLIIRRQLIQNNLVTEQQLYEQYQSNFKQEQIMIIEKFSTQANIQEKQNDERINIDLLKRIDQLEKKVFLKRFKKRKTILIPFFQLKILKKSTSIIQNSLKAF